MTLINAIPLQSTSARPIADIQPAASVGSVAPSSAAGGERSGAGIVGGAEDSVTISNEARERFERDETAGAEGGAGETESVARPDTARVEPDKEDGDEREDEQDEADGEEAGELTESEEDLVDRLEARDLEVRTHEQAHLTAAGDLANGPPKYDYQRGPDGKQYAVGGSVDIDVSPVANDPEATVQKAERIKRAALAPAEPSGKDRQVAARADALKSEAQQKIQKEALEGDEGEAAIGTRPGAAALRRALVTR